MGQNAIASSSEAASVPVKPWLQMPFTHNSALKFKHFSKHKLLRLRQSSQTASLVLGPSGLKTPQE